METYTTIETPLGELVAFADESGRLVRLHFDGARHTPAIPREAAREEEAFVDLHDRLDAYFAGEPTSFDDLPTAPAGSPFQRRVWRALRAIPYGKTSSYARIAGAIGRPGAARAVGHANARNPLCLIVPCHRIIGAHGELTGYAAGLERKRALLRLEAAAAG